MRRLRAFCPAKVNLGLRVLGRRSDGFHEIVTIFQAIDFCDVLEGEVAEDLSLEVPQGSMFGFLGLLVGYMVFALIRPEKL